MGSPLTDQNSGQNSWGEQEDQCSPHAAQFVLLIAPYTLRELPLRERARVRGRVLSSSAAMFEKLYCGFRAAGAARGIIAVNDIAAGDSTFTPSPIKGRE
jgi:hypothetical protein